MTLNEYIKQLARDLNDYDNNNKFIRWKKLQLLFWIKEAISLIYPFFLDDFSFTKILKLKRGHYQDIPDNLNLLDIINQVREDGSFLKEIKKDCLDRAMRWQRVDCFVRNKCYEIEYYRYEDGAKNFYIYPAVPPETDIYISGRFSCTPSLQSLTDKLNIKDIFIPLITQFVLFRALSIDESSVSSLTASATHYNSFINLRRELFLQKNLNNYNLGDKPEVMSQLLQQLNVIDNKKK